MVVIHALIPARSGSKGIPGKCVKLYRGVPLMCHSIRQGLDCKLIDRTVVSTDSEEYAEIAREYGADVPFLRPSEISGDLSTDLEFMTHYLNWCKNTEGEIVPDLIVQLRPTYPNREQHTINHAIRHFVKNMYEYDSLRSVVRFEKSPYKMYRFSGDGDLVPLFKTCDGVPEPYNLCRQSLPTTYIHNGCIDIVRSTTVLEKKSVSGDRICPLLMSINETHDIDTLEDWNRSEEAFNG